MGTSSFQISTDHFKKIKTALYAKDPTLTTVLTRTLRDFSVRPNYFNALDSLIEYLNDSLVDLLFISAKDLYSCQHLLKDHPRILNKECVLVIVWESFDKEDTGIHLSLDGILFQNIYISSGMMKEQLMSALSISHHFHKKSELEKFHLNGMKQIKEKYEGDLKLFKKAELELDRIINLSELIEVLYRKELSDEHEFVMSLANVFDHWKFLTRFSFYTLSPSTKVLKPYEIRSKKFEKLPSISLRSKHEEGIDRYVQEIALQSVFDYWSKEAIMLRIEGSQKNPEILCFLEFELEEFASDSSRFNWDLCEVALSNLYRKVLFRSVEEKNIESNFMTIWDGFDFMDQVNGDEINYKFIDIDLSSINRFISGKPHIKFYWNSFFSDILLSVSKEAGHEAKITTYGTHHIIVMIPTENIDETFPKIKQLIQQSEYWKYFSDIDTIIPQYIAPRLKLISSSSAMFLTKNIFGSDSNKDEVTKTFIYENPYST